MIHDSSLIMPAPIPSGLLGTAEISPDGTFDAGSMQSFELTYTAGFYGIDDSGAIRIVSRFASDQSRPQLDAPTDWGYTTVEASNGAVLSVRIDEKGNVRPWDRTFEIRVVRGYLSEGDTIKIRFGDRRQGSPGMRMQTFVEDTLEFRVLVDPIATGVFQPLPRQPTIGITPGPPHEWRLILPTYRRVGDRFRLSVKADDIWGNPSDQIDATLRLEANLPIAGLPGEIRIKPGDRAVVIERLEARATGDLIITAFDGDRPIAQSNPLRLVEQAELLSFWGDMHGQSEETIGTNSVQDYFHFARDLAFLDIAAHQGNDFQMTQGFWAELNRITRELNADGRFITVPGYEWSGNTALGGDRNVYYFHEGRPIRRSSHAMVLDRSDISSDCGTAGLLFAALANNQEDAVCFAHCGGRYADIKLHHDGRFEHSVEIHSAWGTFEWLLHDAFDCGYPVGIVCNSDGHKGRPGASYAGAAAFGAIGGLTCFLMPELSRTSLFNCLRRRRHYGTTGSRMHLSVEAVFDEDATFFQEDPNITPTFGTPVRKALMGDMVELSAESARLRVEVLAAAPIERIDIFDRKTLVATHRPYGHDELGRRIRVIWEGAEYRGRAREVVWDGTARIEGNACERCAPINFFNRDKTLDRLDESRLRWRHQTTGNFGGFDIWLRDPKAGRIAIETPLIRDVVEIADIGLEERILDASADLPRLLRLFRLPDENSACSMRLEQPLDLTGPTDHAFFVRVTTEDGHRAWSSPIYIGREA